MAGAAPAAPGDLLPEDAARAFRRLFECSSVGLALLTLDGRIFAVNPKLTAELGFSEIALQGRAITDLTHPAETARATESLRRLTGGEIEQYSAERRFVRSDGGIVAAHVDVMLVRNDAGNPLFAVAMYIARDASVAQLRDELRSKAHDLNNLLTAIVGHAEFVLRHEDPHGEAILDAGQRAAALVRKLLMVEPQPRGPRAVDVNDAILGLQTVMAQLVGAGDDIVLSLDPSSPLAVADREDLERALGNLVSNARDAMPHGGRVTIETRAIGDTVEIAVSDTGVGIPKELQKKIFERNYTTKPYGDGFGIGLANVCEFVRSSDGSIKVDSEVAHGATFTMSLPKSP